MFRHALISKTEMIGGEILECHKPNERNDEGEFDKSVHMTIIPSVTILSIIPHKLTISCFLNV